MGRTEAPTVGKAVGTGQLELSSDETAARVNWSASKMSTYKSTTTSWHARVPLQKDSDWKKSKLYDIEPGNRAPVPHSQCASIK